MTYIHVHCEIWNMIGDVVSYVIATHLRFLLDILFVQVVSDDYGQY